MKKRLISSLVLVLATSLAHAQGKSGEQVYRETCAACHGTKFDKAPQLGDRKAWAPLIGEGQHVLTAHAWVGVRAMPPRGGNPALTLEEFSRAVAYLARASGGKWPDPDRAMLAKIRAEEKKRIEKLKAAPKKGV
jgi:cytochrome c5